MSKELQAGYEFTKAQLARLELLEKQNEILTESAKQAAEDIRKCDYTPARSKLLVALNKVKELES